MGPVHGRRLGPPGDVRRFGSPADGVRRFVEWIALFREATATAEARFCLARGPKAELLGRSPAGIPMPSVTTARPQRLGVGRPVRQCRTSRPRELCHPGSAPLRGGPGRVQTFSGPFHRSSTQSSRYLGSPECRAQARARAPRPLTLLASPRKARCPRAQPLKTSARSTLTGQRQGSDPLPTGLRGGRVPFRKPDGGDGWTGSGTPVRSAPPRWVLGAVKPHTGGRQVPDHPRERGPR